MKKVGLVTFHESDNYGTCLQAFALQQVIKSLGYDTKIINYRRANIVSDNKFKYLIKLFKILKSYPGLKIFRYISNRKHLLQKKIKFKEFRKRYYSYTSQSYHSLDMLSEIEDNYDCFVCGSDMVWCADRSDELEVFFLRFTTENKRISYAPSIGSKQIDENYKAFYKTMLSGMKFLSCREQNGIKLIESLINRRPQLVLDPTFLIQRKQWEQIANIHRSSENPKPYVLCYLFEPMTVSFYSSLKKKADLYGMNILLFGMGTEKYYNKDNTIIDSGPIEFLRAIAKSKFVVTNSYHGLIFSLIFNKPFCVLRRKKGGHWEQSEDRFSSILSLLKLNDRMVEYDSNADNLAFDMDYSEINENIEAVIKRSKNYLKSALRRVMENNET